MDCSPGSRYSEWLSIPLTEVRRKSRTSCALVKPDWHAPRFRRQLDIHRCDNCLKHHGCKPTRMSMPPMPVVKHLDVVEDIATACHSPAPGPWDAILYICQISSYPNSFPSKYRLRAQSGRGEFLRITRRVSSFTRRSVSAATKTVLFDQRRAKSLIAYSGQVKH